MRGRLRKAKQLPALLELATVFGPQISPSLTFHVPSTRLSVNKEIFPEIQQMKNTAAQYRMAYLTANQVESFYRVFLINRLVKPEDKVELNTSK